MTISQPTSALNQLFELVNALPKPFTFPPDFQPWLITDEESYSKERDAAFAKAERPIEARMLHPDVIKAEAWYQVDLEEMLSDLEFAKRFESAFENGAGYFKFFSVGPAWSPNKHVFAEYSQHQKKRARNQAIKRMLKKYGLKPDRHSPANEMRILKTRLERSPQYSKLLEYLRGSIFPPVGPEKYWHYQMGAMRRWYDLWDAAYKLWADALLFDSVDQFNSQHYGHLKTSFSARFIDSDGFLRELSGLYSRVLNSGDIEAARIKECQVSKNGTVCGTLFWAKRIDQKTCSNECSNLFHVHRFRHKTRGQKADEMYRRILREKTQ
jgi:hypothetical protein